MPNANKEAAAPRAIRAFFNAHPSEQTKDLKFGFQLNPSLLSGLQTFVSLNKIKAPFWWNLQSVNNNGINGPFFNNPIEVATPALLADNNHHHRQRPPVIDEVSFVNETTPSNSAPLADFGGVDTSGGAIFNQPIIGFTKPLAAAVVQHVGNFELDIAGGRLFHLAKNRYKLETLQRGLNVV